MEKRMPLRFWTEAGSEALLSRPAIAPMLLDAKARLARFFSPITSAVGLAS